MVHQTQGHPIFGCTIVVLWVTPPKAIQYLDARTKPFGPPLQRPSNTWMHQLSPLDHPSKGHPNMDASISLIMRYTYLTDVVIIDATSNHADREAIDGIPSVSMRKDKSTLTRHEEVKPPPAKKSRAASIAEAQVQHARREAVPPKRSTSSTPAPTISWAPKGRPGGSRTPLPPV